MINILLVEAYDSFISNVFGFVILSNISENVEDKCKANSLQDVLKIGGNYLQSSNF